MQDNLIRKKLGSLERCIKRLEEVRGSAGPDSQDIIALELEQSVQLCMDMASHIISLESPDQQTGSISGKIDALQDLRVLSPDLAKGMKKTIELRNIFLDNCRSTSRDSLSSMIAPRITDMMKYAESVSSHLNAPDASV